MELSDWKKVVSRTKQSRGCYRHCQKSQILYYSALRTLNICHFLTAIKRVITEKRERRRKEREAKSSNFESNLYFNYYFHFMSSLRHSNDLSFEEDEVEISDSEVDLGSGKKGGKGLGRPGRPRGKGRPKRSSKHLNKKVSEDEEEWEDKPYIRERAVAIKQQSSIEGYIKIIDYLKKIDYEEGSLQNKMNPYNALTATCFWYAISAEYFSFDFTSKKNSHDTSLDILEKIQKLPLLISNRTTKTQYNPPQEEEEKDPLYQLGKEVGEKMSNLTPAPLAYRPEFIERKIPVSSVAEDNEFISSTRTILYNYISKKIKNSEKWSSLLTSFSSDLQSLPMRQFLLSQPIEVPKEEQPCKEVNLFQLLRQQARKKVQKKEKSKSNKNLQQSQLNNISQENSMKEKELSEEKIEGEVSPVKEEHLGQARPLLEEEVVEAKLQQGNEPEQMEVEAEGEGEVEQREAKIEEEINLKEESAGQIKEQSMKEEMEEENEDRIQGVNKEQLVFQKKEEEAIQDAEHLYRKQCSQQDLVLNSILHMPLDKVISIMQSNLPTVQLPQIKESFMPIPTKDPLEFVFQLHPEEEEYLEYMKQHRKKKYREKVAKSEVNFQEDDRDGQYEDAKCQICTDGDYTDDNLIVFCSMCNISLHQRCVGLAKVPAESWICDVCIAFGPAGINLPCPLCNVRGGAMKRTTIHIDTNIFKQTNPSFYEFAKKCPYSKQKEEYQLKEKVQGEQLPQNEEPEIKVVREKGEKQEECYYDYFVKSTYPSDVPVSHYVWVHYVCAIWVPECYFQQKNGMISVKGIENIDHKRFKSECFACKKTRSGAAVKCEDSQCNKYYHPECARKKKVYMEQLNLEKLKYLIFCEEHEPLKLTRQIQYKKKKNREEIIKFARMIEKYIETYRIAQFPFKLMKSAIPRNFIETAHKSERDDLKDRRAMSVNSDEIFLKNLILNLSKAKMMTVQLERVETGYKITSVETPSKRQIRKCLNRYDEFWNTIKNGDSIEENFRRYERIMMENQKLRERLEVFLNGSLAIKSKPEDKKEKKTGKKRGKQAAAQVETLIEEEGGIFCVCKKPYQGETDMFQCEVCGQWYHFSCLGFIGSEEDAQKMQFTCMKCMKFEDNQKKEERLTKYTGLFSADSILYLYRPPTPDLLSEEEAEPKNYQAIMDEFKQNASPKKEKVNYEDPKPKEHLHMNEVKVDKVQEVFQSQKIKGDFLQKEKNNGQQSIQSLKVEVSGENIEQLSQDRQNCKPEFEAADHEGEKYQSNMKIQPSELPAGVADVSHEKKESENEGNL